MLGALFLGALTGWLSYCFGASPLEAAIWGIAAMIGLVIGWGVPMLER